jgi:hypothetical protein
MVVRVGELMGGLLSVGWRKGTEPGRKWPGLIASLDLHMRIWR